MRWSVFILLMSFSLQLSAAQPVSALLRGLSSEGFWTRIHATEYLLTCHSGAVVQQRLADLWQKECVYPPRDRIGAARVRYRIGIRPAEQLRMLWESALSPESPDRNHALETIGKLQLLLTQEKSKQLQAIWQDAQLPMDTRLFAAWSPTDGSEAFLIKCALATDKGDLALEGLNWRPSLRASTLDGCEVILKDSRYPAISRLQAARLLHRHRRLSVEELLLLHDQLPSSKAILRLWMKVVGEARLLSQKPLLEQLLHSDDIENAMAAQWALDRILNP